MDGPSFENCNLMSVLMAKDANYIEKLMRGTMEWDVVSSLLSGNDTMCFTTEQYEDGRDAWIARIAGATREELGLDKPPIDIARKQLISSGLVKEASRDVWVGV